MTDAIVTTNQPAFLAPVLPVELILAAYQAKKDIVERVLRVNVDYGKIPGSDKDALLKPGAEKFCNFYGLNPTFVDVEVVEDWTGKDHNGEPFFYYRQRCEVYKDGKLVGSADGSCNSWEKKYRYRKQERICPACGEATVIKGKSQYGGGWLCWQKRGGCGAKYSDGDTAIESQEVGYISNPDVAEQVNTILKMAQKRALVAAVLIVTGASDYFTQDIEDFVDGAFTYQPVEPSTPSSEPPRQTTKPPKTNGDGWNPVMILVDASVCEDTNAAASLINHHGPKDILAAHDADALRKWGKAYRGYRDEGFSIEDAVAKALESVG